MSYVVNGTELQTDDQGYLLEPDFSDEVVRVIAAAEGIELNDDHWKVVAFL
ncbi:MAG: TusE/DsrC/DsvC family sulfur relay protein, partial [Rubrivivax sp.]|nr:TusE/DsrC/DsvC family sulfur relay protein [Rubrivivax sp.]